MRKTLLSRLNAIAQGCDVVFIRDNGSCIESEDARLATKQASQTPSDAITAAYGRFSSQMTRRVEKFTYWLLFENQGVNDSLYFDFFEVQLLTYLRG